LEHDASSIAESVVAAEREFSALKSEYDKLVGSRSALDLQRREAERELQAPDYRNVDQDYRDTLIQLKVRRLTHAPRVLLLTHMA